MKENTQYWNETGIKYSGSWSTQAKGIMSKKELNFISNYLKKKNPEVILDIGVGNGRILENHLLNSSCQEIYGIDTASEMVKICKNRFKNEERIKEIKVSDISQLDIPYKKDFDLVSAIRVLKYNRNWKEIITKVSKKLSKDGIFVFTMPNKNSINVLGKANLKYYRTSLKEIKTVLNANNLELLEITSFTKIPDVFYDIFDNKAHSKIICFFERLLELIFGKLLFGRIFFIAAKRKK